MDLHLGSDLRRDSDHLLGADSVHRMEIDPTLPVLPAAGGEGPWSWRPWTWRPGWSWRPWTRWSGGPGGLFRSYRYGPDYPGLVGRDLTPGEKLVDLLAKKDKQDDRPPLKSPTN